MGKSEIKIGADAQGDHVLVDKALLWKLREIAHHAWHVMDDSCEGDVPDDVLILKHNAENLSNALEQIDGGGDIHEALEKLGLGPDFAAAQGERIT